MMRDAYVLGIGQTPVHKAADQSVAALGAAAVHEALANAGIDRVGALYVGNMMSGMLSNQLQLGALIAHTAGLQGIEAATVEAACGSGGAAMRWGSMAVGSGIHDAVVVLGVERMTHVEREHTIRALATASDWSKEGSRGETFLSLNARLMQMYMDRYGVAAEAFAPFAINAHANALHNEHALLRKPLTTEIYEAAKPIAAPVRLFDASPICDGAAAVVLCGRELAMRAKREGRPLVRLMTSAVGTQPLSLSDRQDPLALEAARESAQRAYTEAGIGPGHVNLFEAHDAYTIMSVLSLEACGFARPGAGLELGASGAIRPGGAIPTSTMGGLKARGHRVGATGVYQLVEATQQLRGEAGPNQVRDAQLAMTQSFGGTAATVITHLLERVA